MIRLDQRADGMWVANDEDNSVFFVDRSPALATVGVQVFCALDADLPFDDHRALTDSNYEDERADLRDRLAASVMTRLRGTEASA